MFLLVLAHPGCPGQIPQSRKTVVCITVIGCTAADGDCVRKESKAASATFSHLKTIMASIAVSLTSPEHFSNTLQGMVLSCTISKMNSKSYGRCTCV